MTLQRRAPLRAKPRSKGNRGELAVIQLLRTYGWNPRRNWQSGGQGGGDILGGPYGVHLEVKHREACDVWGWLRQAEREARPTDIPMVVMRRNRMQWWSVMPADEWFALHELTHRQSYTLVRLSRRCRMWDWLTQAEEECPYGQIPVVRFSRPGSGEYAAVPAVEAFALLAERELA